MILTTMIPRITFKIKWEHEVNLMKGILDDQEKLPSSRRIQTNFSYKCKCDIANTNNVPVTFEAALRLVEQLPDRLANVNGGKGMLKPF